MSEPLLVPLWALGLGVLGLCAVAYVFGYAADSLSRRRFAVRLAGELGVAFAVGAGLVLGVGGALTALSLLA